MAVTMSYRQTVHDLVTDLFKNAKKQFENKHKVFLSNKSDEARELVNVETKGGPKSKKKTWPEWVEHITYLEGEYHALGKRISKEKDDALEQCFPKDTPTWWSGGTTRYENMVLEKYREVLADTETGREYLDFDEAFKNVAGMIALARSERAIVNLYVDTATRLGVKIPQRLLDAIGVRLDTQSDG